MPAKAVPLLASQALHKPISGGISAGPLIAILAIAALVVTALIIIVSFTLSRRPRRRGGLGEGPSSPPHLTPARGHR